MSRYIVSLENGKQLEADDILINERQGWMRYIVPYDHNHELIRLSLVVGIREKNSRIGNPVSFGPGEITRGWKRPFSGRRPFTKK